MRIVPHPFEMDRFALQGEDGHYYADAAGTPHAMSAVQAADVLAQWPEEVSADGGAAPDPDESDDPLG